MFVTLDALYRRKADGEDSSAGKWFGVFFLFFSTFIFGQFIGTMSSLVSDRQKQDKIAAALDALNVFDVKLLEAIDKDDNSEITPEEWFTFCVQLLDLVDDGYLKLIWEKFDAVCHAAYLPVAWHFEHLFLGT